MIGQSNVWLNTEQAAALLGVRERQIVRLCSDRILSGAIKHKGRWKIPVFAIREYEGRRKGKVPIEAGCTRRVRGYLLHYIATLGGEAQSFGTALLELYTKPSLDNYSQERLKDLENSLVDSSKYIAEIWADIRRLDDELRLAGFGSLLTPEQGG